ncbi:hypothetical protein [Streptomyces boncukensis]|uniref:Tetratricopeptide repeat protein n=1 Tax=Streptomyces boncukensis TaxID=2711219 RepID=A0A6G4X3U4_9ACTN|nr:hypothetical protein [Streptomyces boncukensis]NGO72209.1 hypothetical protein [Streptomyces boncukensis]
MAEPQREAPRGALDATLVRLGQAIMLHRGGDREEARNRLAALWQEAEESGHLFHRCTIAHHMADTQDDPADELRWDLCALAAADALTGRREARDRWAEHVRAVRSLYPALYLNLASDHAKLGDGPSARRELTRARGVLGELADDTYGAGIRAAVARLETRLAGSTPP